MGRMKHGKPNPHNDRSKVIVKKKNEKEKNKNEGVEDKNKNDGTDRVIPEEYRKRLLESNHDRYDEPDIEFEDEDDDVVDETKSLEYIKTHYSGISSHFQFDDEKEWNDEKDLEASTDANVLQLDLHQLSTEISKVDTHEKLNLKDVNERHVYCVENLADMCATSKRSKPSNTFETRKSNQGAPFVWSYEGLEQSHFEHKTSLRTKTNTENTIISYRQSSNVKKLENKFDNDSNQLQEGDEDSKKELTPLQPGDDDQEIITTEQSKVFDDLDELLNSPVQDNANKEDTVNEKDEAISNLKETGAKELDDWLDSIL